MKKTAWVEGVWGVLILGCSSAPEVQTPGANLPSGGEESVVSPSDATEAGAGGMVTAPAPTSSTTVDASPRPGVGEADAGPERVLCDGSDELRLALVTIPVPGSSEVSLAWDLGSKSTYVRGDCRYWVQEVHQDTETVRTGVLTEELAQELARDMGYSKLDQFDDLYRLPMTLPTYMVVSDGQKSVWCAGCFEGETRLPADLIAMVTAYPGWRERLLSSSEDVTGPMRVVLHKYYLEPGYVPDTGDCDLTWPFSFDPEPLAQEGDRSQLKSFVIDDPAQAQELRDWWRGNLATPNVCFAENSGGTFYTDGERPAEYRLWMRDWVPLENGDGRIAIPTPEGL